MANIRNIFDIVTLQAGAPDVAAGPVPGVSCASGQLAPARRRPALEPGHLEGDGTLPFSLDLLQIAKHPLVCDRGEATRHHLLAQHLYRFCHFTEHLELEAVVPACVRLRFANTPFSVPRLLSRDAGRAAVDETWHAECADDLRANIRSAVGVEPCRTRTPMFQNVLRVVKAALPDGYDVLADLTFSLRVRNADHGQPEQGASRHRRSSAGPRGPSRTCARGRLPPQHLRAGHRREMGSAHPAQRDVVGPLYAIFISAFLQPDTLAELDALESAGYMVVEAQRIVEETREASTEETRRQLWKAASPTVRCMQQHGLLDHAATRESLEMMELLPSRREPETQMPN